MIIVQFDAKHRIGQNFGHDAFEFEQVFFRHEALSTFLKGLRAENGLFIRFRQVWKRLRTQLTRNRGRDYTSPATVHQNLQPKPTNQPLPDVF